MALIIKDRVMEISTTTGTGNFTLGGAFAGFRAFSAVCATNDVCAYYIEAVDGSGVATGDWETGIGTYSALNTLTRTTVTDSSNSGSAVSFAAGNKRVGIAITAAMAASPILIKEVVTSSSQTTVSFAPIPQYYRDLVLVVRGRGTASAANVNVLLQFNGDTGSNYDKTDTEAHAGTGVTLGEALASTSIVLGYMAAGTAPSNVADKIDARIADYRGTTFQKALTAQSTLKVNTTAGNVYVIATSAWWRSTAAISSILISLSSGGFVDNSVASLYGSL